MTDADDAQTEVDAKPAKRYHHGDLRRAVMEAAVEVIETQGVGAVSLRGLARRAGVSHAAPAHHFGDRTGLLTAIAVQGFDLLVDSFPEPGSDGEPELVEYGVHFVRFALEHPAHFRLMYDHDLINVGDPRLVVAQKRAGWLLASGGRAPGTSPTEPGLPELGTWSLAYGFATLCLTGNLDPVLAGRDPAVLFRRMTEMMLADAEKDRNRH